MESKRVPAILVTSPGKPSEAFFENSTASEILTLPEVADRLKVSVSGLRKILRRQGIPGAFKVGQQWRFYWSMVARHLLSEGDSYGVP